MWLPDPKAIPALREWAGLPEEDDAPLTALYARVKKDPRLKNLYEEGLRRFEDGENLMDWRPPAEEEATLSLLLALSAIPSARVAHARRSVDPAISRATTVDVGAAVGRWRRQNGHTGGGPLGIERWLVTWFRLLASGNIYRLGRMQFVPVTFGGEVAAFRQRETGEVVALAPEGALFTAEGYRTEVDAPGVWQTTLTQSTTEITGFVVSPTGKALPRTRTLPFPLWEPALTVGNDVLDVHIPEGGPLTEEECRNAFVEAQRFFPTKYPEKRFRAFVCVSWLLDPAWEQRLGAEANIVRFQQQGYLYPVISGTREGTYYVFDTFDPNPETIRRETRIQEVMANALQQGTPLRSGGLFLLWNDVERWGAKPYQSGT